MYAKKLQFDGTVFGNCMTEVPAYRANQQIKQQLSGLAVRLMGLIMQKIFRFGIGTSDIDRQINEIQGQINSLNSQLRPISCIKSDSDVDQYAFLADNLLSTPDLRQDFYKSFLAKFTDKGKYEVYIFFPNLRKHTDGTPRYMSNLSAYSNSNQWMKDFSENNIYYSIMSILPDYRKFLLRFIRDESLISRIVASINRENWKEYPFIKESNNICFTEGCACDFGEDISSMVPAVTKAGNTNSDNTNKKAPYFPTKCLRQSKTDLNNYKDNFFDTDDSFYDEMKGKLIGDCLNHYKDNAQKIQNGETPDNDSESSLIESLKKCGSEYRKKEKANDATQYSEEYNRKILNELAIRNSGYPGVQENVFPLFKVNI